MGTANLPVTQASLAACAFAAALAYGGPWLGLTWVYHVEVNGSAFDLGPEFPLGMLAAMVMGAAAGLARGGSKNTFAPAGLMFGAGAIIASSLFILLVWGPGGAPAGQLELLRDASRLGFTVLALSLPFALPPGAPPLARLGSLAFGVLLAPVLLFPHHAEAAGLTDVHGTLPMLLFFLQGLLALSGTANLRGKGWGRSAGARPKQQDMDGFSSMRAFVGAPQPKKRRRGPAVPVGWERLNDTLARRPSGPAGPERPPAQRGHRARGQAWFFQF